MSRRLIPLLLLMLWIGVANAVAPGVFTATVAATDTNTNTALTVTGTVASYKQIVIINNGPNTVYVDFDGVAATTNVPVASGDSPTFSFINTPMSVTAVGLICDATETATVVIVALP